VPGQEKRAGALPQGNAVTLICNSNGKLVREIDHYGNYEPFGEFLAANRVTIRSPEDAKLVWEAFCDLHQKHWKDQRAIKISDTVWHLGDTTIGNFHYYYQIILDADQTVVSAKLHADDLNRPKSK
jgi:hypothetical protein